MNNGIQADGQGIARQFDERLAEASAVIDQYVKDGSEDRPHIEVTVDELALRAVKRALKAKGRDFDPGDPVANSLMDQARDRITDLLANRCTNEFAYPHKVKTSKSGNEWFQTFPVDLDLAQVADKGTCPPWALGEWSKGHQDPSSEWVPVPRVYFAQLDPLRDSLYEAGKVEAIAVYWDGSLVTDPESKSTGTWRVKGTNTVVPFVNISDWDPAGYQVGIMRTFGSRQAMKQAYADLKAAIRLINSPVPTDEADADSEGLPPILEEEPELEIPGI